MFMEGNNFISLITGLGAGLLFINGQTAGALTQTEILLDVFLIILVLTCIVFNKNLSSLAEKYLPFVAPVLDSVEACCQDVNKRKEQKQNVEEVDCKCNTPPAEKVECTCNTNPNDEENGA